MIQHTRLINTRFTSNTYILSKGDDNSVWLIDPGDVQQILDWLAIHKKDNVAGILLTHTHFDHFYGANDILLRFSCPLYVAGECGAKGLFDSKQNGSKYTELGVVTVSKDTKIVFYGKELLLWQSEVMKVLITPGHSEDSVCLQIGNLLFTGDTLIYNYRTVTKLRGGDISKLESSIKQLQTLTFKGLQVCPGHGEEFLLDGYDLRKALGTNEEKTFFHRKRAARTDM